jgi:hypothetical protein
MALKDLIGPAPTPAAERRPDITCKTNARGEGKRFIHDAANGACALPDKFMGVEWLKANGPKHAHSRPVVTEPPKPVPPARDLFGNPLPEVASTPAIPNPSTPPGGEARGPVARCPSGLPPRRLGVGPSFKRLM